MGGEFGHKIGAGSLIQDTTNVGTSGRSVGKHTLTQSLSGDAGVVQRVADRRGADEASGTSIQQAAAAGVAGAGSAMPHATTIQALFGRHDISGVRAHVGGVAETSSRMIGAEAYATGNHVAFAAAPSLHTAAHEAAHVVQQRGGVQLKGGVGESGDVYEKHADQVADAVVQGKSAESLLDRFAAKSSSSGPAATTAVQRFESAEHALIGDQVHMAAGVSAPLSSPENQRLLADGFLDQHRDLSLELRNRNPVTGLPTETTSSVQVSYGEMISLSGDFYFSVDNLRKAPAQEVIAIRNLVAQERQGAKIDFDSAYEAATTWRRQGVYQPGTGTQEGTKGQAWGVQPGDPAHDAGATYIDLATENNAHFSAATGALAVPDGPEGNAARDNHQAWLTDHSRAISLAQRVRELKRKRGQLPGAAATASSKPSAAGATLPQPGAAGSSAKAAQPSGYAAPAMSAGAPVDGTDSTDIETLENLAYVYNAGADHYLTDAFSAGHLINKAQLAPITDRVLNEGMFEAMVNALLPLAMKEPAVLGLSPNALGIGGGAIAGTVLLGPLAGPLLGAGLGAYGGHKGMEPVVRKALREGLSVFRTDSGLRHNVGAKLVHDYLNAHGATVTSRNGRFRYKTMGDGELDGATKDIASRAVLASRNYIRALMYDSDAELAKPENADDAWDYTPNVDVTRLTSQAEPMLRAQLSDTPYLWALMKVAVKVKEGQAEQKKVEKGTQQVAQKDRGGDWGQAPQSRFTRRTIITGIGNQPMVDQKQP